MTTLGIVCGAACMLMMVAMMGGAGWLMTKLRPSDERTRVGTADGSADAGSERQPQPVA